MKKTYTIAMNDPYPAGDQHCDFSNQDGRSLCLIDIVSYGNFVDMDITANSEAECDAAFNSQLSDGLFTNCKISGHHAVTVKLSSITRNATNSEFLFTLSDGQTRCISVPHAGGDVDMTRFSSAEDFVKEAMQFTALSEVLCFVSVGDFNRIVGHLTGCFDSLFNASQN